MLSHSAITAAIGAHFPSATILAVERLPGGVSAEVYRVDLSLFGGGERSVVLRAMGRSGLESTKEHALISALHPAGLPVPRPLLFDDCRTHIDRPYLVMEFVEGSSAIPEERADARIAAMADTLAMIHRVPTRALPRLPLRLDPVPELAGFLPSGGDWRDVKALCAALDPGPYEGAPVLLHGDFWANNLLWRDERIVAVLDWEDAAHGDPLSDVACALLELRYLFPEARAECFLAAYERHFLVDSRRLALWRIHVAAAAQHHMAGWGLDPAREAHMRRTALHQIRAAADSLL